MFSQNYNRILLTKKEERKKIAANFALEMFPTWHEIGKETTLLVFTKKAR